MIVPQLMGGVCNQMFQIAAGFSRAIDMNTDFAINYNMPFGCGQGKPPSAYRDTLYAKIPSTDYVPAEKWHEPHWHYAPLPNKKDFHYSGYFQSEKHFKHNAGLVKHLFNFPAAITEEIDSKLNSLPNKKIGIHIRRGDYKPLSTIHMIHGASYYDRAIQMIADETAHLIVCTDDINSARNDVDMTKMIWSNSKSELHDLYLLSQCDSVIMCNSTFSWWGAYLGKRKDVVICPAQWFGPEGPPLFDDVFNDEWIKI